MGSTLSFSKYKMLYEIGPQTRFFYIVFWGAVFIL